VIEATWSPAGQYYGKLVPPKREMGRAERQRGQSTDGNLKPMKYRSGQVPALQNNNPQLRKSHEFLRIQDKLFVRVITEEKACTPNLLSHSL
jgi:hypothetical protein